MSDSLLPFAAAGAAGIVVNRWLQRRNVPVLGTVAGLSNRVVGVTASTGLRATGMAVSGIGIAVVGLGGVARGLAEQVDRFTSGDSAPTPPE